MNVRKFFKMLLCKHEYEKIGWDAAMENNLIFSIRYYRCKKCGHRITVDGRCDPFV